MNVYGQQVSPMSIDLDGFAVILTSVSNAQSREFRRSATQMFFFQ